MAFGACVAFSSYALAAEAVNRPVTFARDVAPIFQEKCQNCHRAGAMAPMSLVTYEETRPWARAIRQRVLMRQMPPWHIDKTVGIQQFQNDISLSDEQIATIVRWVDDGAPRGDMKDMRLLNRCLTTTAGSLPSSLARPISSSNQSPGRCPQLARTYGSSL